MASVCGKAPLSGGNCKVVTQKGARRELECQQREQEKIRKAKENERT